MLSNELGTGATERYVKIQYLPSLSEQSNKEELSDTHKNSKITSVKSTTQKYNGLDLIRERP